MKLLSEEKKYNSSSSRSLFRNTKNISETRICLQCFPGFCKSMHLIQLIIVYCKKNWKTMLLEEFQTNGVLPILIADTKLWTLMVNIQGNLPWCLRWRNKTSRSGTPIWIFGKVNSNWETIKIKWQRRISHKKTLP